MQATLEVPALRERPGQLDNQGLPERPVSQTLSTSPVAGMKPCIHFLFTLVGTHTAQALCQMQATLEARAPQERPGLPERQVKPSTLNLPKARDNAMIYFLIILLVLIQLKSMNAMPNAGYTGGTGATGQTGGTGETGTRHASFTQAL